MKEILNPLAPASLEAISTIAIHQDSFAVEFDIVVGSHVDVAAIGDDRLDAGGAGQIAIGVNFQVAAGGNRHSLSTVEREASSGDADIAVRFNRQPRAAESEYGSSRCNDNRERRIAVGGKEAKHASAAAGLHSQ